MRDRTNIQDALRTTQQNLIQIKSSQIATGDSWVPYRIFGTFPLNSGQKAVLRFTPDSGGPFMANVYEYTGWLTPEYGFAELNKFFADYSKAGVYYFTKSVASLTTIGYLIESSKKGTVEISYI